MVSPVIGFGGDQRLEALAFISYLTLCHRACMRWGTPKYTT